MILHPSAEISFVLVYCVLAWGAFSLALGLADPQHRLRTAAAGGMLVLLLVSILGMLAAFATSRLQTGEAMTAAFQIAVVVAGIMAVSRVCQMLAWPRTWLAAAYGLATYLGVSLILSRLLQLWH